MRLVLDTNVVVAGLLWAGPPRRLLESAINEVVTLSSSPTLIEELARTLGYAKLLRRMAQVGTTPAALAAEYAALVTLVSPTQVPRVIEHDADDDHVLACALASQANLIVSGDKHLHSLGGSYKGMGIVTPAQAVQMIAR